MTEAMRYDHNLGLWCRDAACDVACDAHPYVENRGKERRNYTGLRMQRRHGVGRQNMFGGCTETITKVNAVVAATKI